MASINDAVETPFGVLVPGKRYWLRYRLYGQRRDRTAIMSFMGAHEQLGKSHLMWSARPVAGTQSLPLESVFEISERDERHAIFIDRKI